MKIRLQFRRGWEKGDYKLESIFGVELNNKGGLKNGRKTKKR